MGTRNIIAVFKDGDYKVAQYAQWDGYPSGQGVGVLRFLQNEDLVEKLKNKLSNVRFIDNIKDKDFMESYNKNAPEWSSDPDNRTSEQKRWFKTYMSRDIGSDILMNIAESIDEEIIIQNSINFAANSLMCEYAYVIDFDKNTFEVYEGFNETPLDENERFAKFKCEDDYSSNNYFPVNLWHKFDLNNLPTEEEFLKICEE